MQLALEKKERLSPSPCMHTASTWGEGTFCLDREFSKNAPYKQRIIFHTSLSPVFHTGILGVDSIKGDESMPWQKRGGGYVEKQRLGWCGNYCNNISYVMLCGAEHHHPPPVWLFTHQKGQPTPCAPRLQQRNSRPRNIQYLWFLNSILQAP